ncbi:hypothetical protein GQ600_17716 [Phytophthora cactorum]|nr:hypothetical protein GQ600_17716 [Phytophthora cactorum]
MPNFTRPLAKGNTAANGVEASASSS